MLLWPAAAFRVGVSRTAPPVCPGKLPMSKWCKSVSGINLDKKKFRPLPEHEIPYGCCSSAFSGVSTAPGQNPYNSGKSSANVRQTKSKADYINRLPMMYKTVIIMQ